MELLPFKERLLFLSCKRAEHNILNRQAENCSWAATTQGVPIHTGEEIRDKSSNELKFSCFQCLSSHVCTRCCTTNTDETPNLAYNFSNLSRFCFSTLPVLLCCIQQCSLSSSLTQTWRFQIKPGFLTLALIRQITERAKFGFKAPPPQSPYPDGPFHNLVKSATATSCGVTLGACSCVRQITDNCGSRAASFKTPSPSIWST